MNSHVGRSAKRTVCVVDRTVGMGVGNLEGATRRNEKHAQEGKHNLPSTTRASVLVYSAHCRPLYPKSGMAGRGMSRGGEVWSVFLQI